MYEIESVYCTWLCVILYAGDVRSVNLESFDVSVIANMVKKYLRELPDPVIPEDSYSSYIEAASTYAAERFHISWYLAIFSCTKLFLAYIVDHIWAMMIVFSV